MTSQYGGIRPLVDQTDISPVAFKTMAIILKLRRRCNGFPSATIRLPDFDELAVFY